MNALVEQNMLVCVTWNVNLADGYRSVSSCSALITVYRYTVTSPKLRVL
jgi:hypothetical protein